MASLARCLRHVNRMARPQHHCPSLSISTAPSFTRLTHIQSTNTAQRPICFQPRYLSSSRPTTPPSAANTSAPQPSSPASTYHLLHYRYVPQMTTRRTPHRPHHLQHASTYVTTNKLLLGGACPPEVKEAYLVFRGVGRGEVEEFARKDPYVVAGLVEEWRVLEWAVVIGSAM